MKMEHIRGDRKGFFRAVDGSVEAGSKSYYEEQENALNDLSGLLKTLLPDRMIIDHTEVAGHYSGEGGGKMLVVPLAEYARANSRKVIPLCSFARAVFDKMLGIRDVLVR